MTDPLLQQFNDGGDIEFINGRITLSDGLETAAYLSLFGANERDPGLEGDDPLEWWGNKTESLEERKYRSQFQHLIESLPLVPANLRRLEDAAGVDLAWFVSSGVASFVQVVASQPAINRVKVDIGILVDNELFQFSFTAQPSGQAA